MLDADGWPATAVAKSLANDGWDVLAPAGSRVARSGFCAWTVPLPHAADAPDAFAAAVPAAVDACDVELVAPAEDASVELLYDLDLPPRVAVLGGDRTSAAVALDKAETLKRARAAGFPTPYSVVPVDTADAVDAADDLGYPCVVKPRRSYARRGDRLVARRHVIARSASDIRSAVDGFIADGFEPPLVQELVPGRSFGVAALRHHGALIAFGVREAFCQLPIAGGTAVRRRTVAPDAEGVHEALSLLETIGFEGLGDVQFHLASDGRPYLMEIGARTFGWMPLAIEAGLDLPRLGARALRGERVGRIWTPRPGVEMLWLRGALARIGEALDPNAPLPPGTSRTRALADSWPLWRPGLLYDGHGLSAKRPLRPSVVSLGPTPESE